MSKKRARSTPESAVPEARQGLFYRVAEGILGFIERHPVANLIGVLWLIAVSLWSPFDAWRRAREEATRSGLTEAPRVELFFDERECRFKNADIRPLAEVRLNWVAVQVDVTSCDIAGKDGPSDQLLNAAHELKPLEQVSVPMLSNWKLMCPVRRYEIKGHTIEWLMECRATYHRPADMRRYDILAYVVADPDCSKLVPLRHIWDKGERARRIMSCLPNDPFSQRKAVWDSDALPEELRQTLPGKR